MDKTSSWINKLRRMSVSSEEGNENEIVNVSQTSENSTVNENYDQKVLKNSNTTNIIVELSSENEIENGSILMLSKENQENTSENENANSKQQAIQATEEAVKCATKNTTSFVTKIDDNDRVTRKGLPPSKFSEYREIHDLTKLDCITLENVLECLLERYRSHYYYTYAGPVLLSLNSCLKVPRASLVEDVTRMSWYFIDDTKRGSQQNNEDSISEQKSPHVYDIARKCLRNLVTIGSHQIILVSGESGAGKTTATQQLIKYLTENNSRNFGANICSNLDKKIYFATIILESFGNAKTQANPNSSRFGRLVQLNYSKNTGRITGAEIQTYLLEKHRVAKFDFQCERSFHIFYYILHGLKTGVLSLSNIPSGGDGWKAVKELVPEYLLSQALECDDDEVQRLLHAVQAFNMTDDFTELVSVLFALIALLKLLFIPDCDTSSEEEYHSGLESPYKTDYTVSDWSSASMAAGLLGVKDTDLVDILIARKITAGSSHRHSIFRKPCESTSECEERLQALVSFLYDRLFTYILENLNTTMTGDNLVDGPDDKTTLSLLDLYGFENFSVNHLEQMCINYANERLQQVNVSIIKSYYDQSNSLDEITMPPTELIRIENELHQRIEELHAHVFSFFDQECLLKRSSEDKDLLERMNISTKNSQFIQTGKLHEPVHRFTVTHYATKVDYRLTGIVQKNKDHIPPEFQDILKSSSNSFISSLFQHDLVRCRNLSGVTRRPGISSNNKNSRGKTILTRFKASVEELMARLKASEDKDVHFIRCIRPNADLLAGNFSKSIVEKQLHACGIADVVKIAGNGYPIRVHLNKFLKEFSKVILFFCNGPPNFKTLSIIFSSSTDVMPLKFGKSMVFMSEKCWKNLKKSERFIMGQSTKVIQRTWKNHLEREEQRKRERNQSTSTSLDVNITLSDLELVSDCTTIDSQNMSQYSTGPFGDAGLDSLNVTTPFSLNAGISFTSTPRNSQLENRRKPRVPLYNWTGLASRVPIHTLPIKFYTKKTCLPNAGKAPRRLIANGIPDAIEDYGIIFIQT